VEGISGKAASRRDGTGSASAARARLRVCREAAVSSDYSAQFRGTHLWADGRDVWRPALLDRVYYACAWQCHTGHCLAAAFLLYTMERLTPGGAEAAAGANCHKHTAGCLRCGATGDRRKVAVESSVTQPALDHLVGR
jgi:hypothetical protein